MTTVQTPIEVCCPHCKQTNLASRDTVEATAEIRAFALNANGELVAEYTGRSEVNWDTQGPIDPAAPYVCLECEKALAPQDLLRTRTLLAPLDPERRKAMIEKLCADIVEGASRPSLTLWDMAEKGFGGFASRTDAELIEAYESAFGEEVEA